MENWEELEIEYVMTKYIKALLVLACISFIYTDDIGMGRFRVGARVFNNPDNRQNCISDVEREHIMNNMLHVDIESMRDPVLFHHPVGNGGMMNSDKQYITNYVDENLAYGWIEDYSCYYVTYDGHWGTDIAVGGFYYMDEMTTPVLAAADGIVTYTHDGEFDRWMYWSNTAVSNTVAIQHNDGTRTFYLHMKKNSITVSVGDNVQTGDTLGYVGSSGYSDGPHLHFEVNTANWDLVDPWEGNCGMGESRWVNQIPFIGNSSIYPQRVFRYLNTAYPAQNEDEFHQIVSENIPSLTHINPGEDYMSLVWVRNLQVSDTLTWRWYKDGLLVDENFLIPGQTEWWYSGTPYYATSYWYIVNTWFSGDENIGDWDEKVFLNSTLVGEKSFICDTIPNQIPIVVSQQYDIEMGQIISGEFELDDDGEPFWFNLDQGSVNGGIVENYGGRRRKFSYTAPTDFTGIDMIGVSAVDDRGVSGPISNIIFNVTGSLSVNESSDIPDKYMMHQNYPNPFNPVTNFRYDLPKYEYVNISIYDLMGVKVKVLVNSIHSPGSKIAQWDGTNDQNNPVSAGLYFFKIQAGTYNKTKKMLLLK